MGHTAEGDRSMFLANVFLTKHDFSPKNGPVPSQPVNAYLWQPAACHNRHPRCEGKLVMPRTYTQGDEPIPGSGYRLSSFLGRGGFGEVWKATAPGGAEAALKIIHLGGQEGRKEFRALQLVKRIRHPNLVPIIAFWLKGHDGSILDDAIAGGDSLPADESGPAGLRRTMAAPPDLGRAQAAELIIAMGLGDLSLFDRFQQCRDEGREGIPRDELLGYMEDVAEAIDFLNSPVHDMGSGPAAIQHCDIKPHNLMIVGGAAQICDFGLARMLGADRTTSAAATIAYAAPECLQTGRPSASTDQYSLAVSYYELQHRRAAVPGRDAGGRDGCEAAGNTRFFASRRRRTSGAAPSHVARSDRAVPVGRGHGNGAASGPRPTRWQPPPKSITFNPRFVAVGVLSARWSC